MLPEFDNDPLLELYNIIYATMYRDEFKKTEHSYMV